MEEKKCCPTCGQKIREKATSSLTDKERLDACVSVFKETGRSRIGAEALVSLALHKCTFDVNAFNVEHAAMVAFIRESGMFVSFKGKSGGIELAPSA